MTEKMDTYSEYIAVCHENEWLYKDNPLTEKQYNFAKNLNLELSDGTPASTEQKIGMYIRSLEDDIILDDGLVVSRPRKEGELLPYYWQYDPEAWIEGSWEKESSMIRQEKIIFNREVMEVCERILKGY